MEQGSAGTFWVLGKMINRCAFPFPNISPLNCKVASCLFWSTICPTFQAQLIANFLCHDESMIYLTNFHPENKPTFVLPGGHFPNITAQPGMAATVGRGTVAKMMNRKMGNHGSVPTKHSTSPSLGFFWQAQAPWNNRIFSCICFICMHWFKCGTRCLLCPNAHQEFNDSVLRKGLDAPKWPWSSKLQIRKNPLIPLFYTSIPPKFEKLCFLGRVICLLALQYGVQVPKFLGFMDFEVFLVK